MQTLNININVKQLFTMVCIRVRMVGWTISLAAANAIESTFWILSRSDSFLSELTDRTPSTSSEYKHIFSTYCQNELGEWSKRNSESSRTNEVEWRGHGAATSMLMFRADTYWKQNNSSSKWRCISILLDKPIYHTSESKTMTWNKIEGVCCASSLLELTVTQINSTRWSKTILTL